MTSTSSSCNQLPSSGVGRNPTSVLTELKQASTSGEFEFEWSDGPSSGSTPMSPGWDVKLTITNKGQVTNFRASGSSKQDARILAATLYCQQESIDWTSPISKTQLSPQPFHEMTADEALYSLKDFGCISSIVMDDSKKFFCGSVLWKNYSPFTARIIVSKDHSACKKMVALKLLAQLSRAQHPKAMIHYQYLRPDIFLKGHYIKNEEGTEDEFKGAETEVGHINTNTLMGPYFENKLRTVCAFLNTAGGSLWVGIHDSGCIQGVMVDTKQKDQIELKIRNQLGAGLEPYSSDYIQISWHLVRDETQLDESLDELMSPPVPLPPIPTIPLSQSAPTPPNSMPLLPPKPDLTNATNDLQAYITALESRLYLKSQRSANSSQLHILRISVLKHPAVHFWNNIAYYRNGNQTIVMPIPMMKQKIVTEMNGN